MSAIDVTPSAGPPFLMRNPWLASKYGTEKSTTLERSSVMVTSLIAMPSWR
jgi:hypothetical protein